jgi:phage terminase large subunit-like protein
VQEYTPSRGNDKTARVNAISDLFSSGFVWRPDTRWAKDVAEECAAFPNAPHDDFVDTTTQALIRVRRSGLLQLPSDYKDEEQPLFRSRRGGYYGWTARR